MCIYTHTYIYIYMYRYLDPQSIQNDAPRPLNRAQETIILHTFAVQVDIKHSSATLDRVHSTLAYQIALEGKQMYPFLVDENTGVRMNESAEINAYLWKTYGSEAKACLRLIFRYFPKFMATES